METIVIKCSQCGKEYKYNRNHRAGANRVTCGSCTANNFKRKRKEKLVRMLGGKCHICGYDKCMGALEFHHKNREEKKYNISKFGMVMPLNKLKEELDKCVLVCSNCHKEIHYSNITNK